MMEFKVPGTCAILRGEPCAGVAERLAQLIEDLSAGSGSVGFRPQSGIVVLDDRRAQKVGESESAYRRRCELETSADEVLSNCRDLFLAEHLGRDQILRDHSDAYIKTIALPAVKDALNARPGPKWCRDIVENYGAKILLADLFGGAAVPSTIHRVARIYGDGGWWVDYRARKDEVHGYFFGHVPADNSNPEDAEAERQAVLAAQEAWKQNPALVDLPVGDGIDGLAAQERCLATNNSQQALYEFWTHCSPSPSADRMLRQIARWCVGHGRDPDGGIVFRFAAEGKTERLTQEMRCAPPYLGPLTRVCPGQARVMRLHNGVIFPYEPLWYPFDGQQFVDLELSAWWQPDDDDPLAFVQCWFPIERDGELYGVHPLEAVDGNNPYIVELNHDYGQWKPAEAADMGELLIRFVFEELRALLND